MESISESSRRLELPMTYQSHSVGQWQREKWQSTFYYANEWLNAEHCFPVMLCLPLRHEGIRIYNTHPFLMAVENTAAVSEEFYRVHMRLLQEERHRQKDKDWFFLISQCIGLFNGSPANNAVYDFFPLHDLSSKANTQCAVEVMFKHVERNSFVPARDKQIWLKYLLLKYLLEEPEISPFEVIVQLSFNSVLWHFYPAYFRHNADTHIKMVLMGEGMQSWTAQHLAFFLQEIQVKAKYLDSLWSQCIKIIWSQRTAILNATAMSVEHTRQMNAVFKRMDRQKNKIKCILSGLKKYT